MFAKYILHKTPIKDSNTKITVINILNTRFIFTFLIKKYTPKHRSLKRLKQKYKRFMRDMKFFLQYDIINFIYYTLSFLYVNRK